MSRKVYMVLVADNESLVDPWQNVELKFKGSTMLAPVVSVDTAEEARKTLEAFLKEAKI